jgi:hypothetical protein
LDKILRSIIQTHSNVNYLFSSTRYSAYKKLLTNGFLIQIAKSYQLEDPFFERWILKERGLRNDEF